MRNTAVKEIYKQYLNCLEEKPKVTGLSPSLKCTDIFSAQSLPYYSTKGYN